MKEKDKHGRRASFPSSFLKKASRIQFLSRLHNYDHRESFVNNLYKGILGREGDPDGVRSHLATLGMSPSFSDAETLLQNFLNSSEYIDKVKSSTQIIKIDTTNYDNLISIGSHCITSSVLKKNHLKKWSGPFDWIFSNLGMVAHCIADDFNVFLDR